MHRLYHMKENGGGGAIALNHACEAKQWNEQRGAGIFWTIQEFEGDRKKQNLTALNGFAVDIDSENKEETQKLISKGLYPTWLIETKRGYHVYWLFKEPLKVTYSEELEGEYRATLQNKLIPFYKADNKAADLCRLLRAPYFLHLKNPQEPFLVTPIQENNVRYTWEQIDRFFPDDKADNQWAENVNQAKKALQLPKGNKIFDRIYQLNSEQALEALSGNKAVNGEVYSFRKTSNGSKNIFVNGKSTSCWIDKSGHIGSLDKGGPTIWQWLYWYSRDHKKVYETIKEVFRDIGH